jgi:3-oxoacyl-[acyl-carrier-protein] synthase II
VSRLSVVITGVGCLSPLGNDVESSWRGAVAGASGVGPIQAFDASEHETRFAAEVKGFDADALLGRRRRDACMAKFHTLPPGRRWSTHT